MSEFITRETAKCAIENTLELYPSELKAVFEEIDRAPGAYDVAPVRHGRWIKKHRHRGGFRRYTGLDDLGERHTITVDERYECDDPYCSECGKLAADDFLDYCPKCGAKMDLPDVVPGMCCDCKYDQHGFCGDYSENENCEHRKEDGSCWGA